MKSTDSEALKQYLLHHSQVRDVLFTGGDPMVMPASTLDKYIRPLLDLETLDTIRIGSKSIAYWPWRYISDPDAPQVLKLFSDVVRAGKQLAFQAHFSHPRELETPAAQQAVRLIRSTGAQIRTQAPLIRGVNDHSAIWTNMWESQVRLGLIPYYMCVVFFPIHSPAETCRFVERDTGPRDYFSVPLATAYKIFSDAYSAVPGTARTVRGPSMSASPGKISIAGIEEIAGQKLFALRFLQARNPEWTNRLFFAKYDPNAIWLDDLKPGLGEEKFFYESDSADIANRSHWSSSGQMM
jgi:L-lysine 2,3-aminomutase